MPLLYHWRGENHRREIALSFDYTLRQRTSRLHDIALGESLWAFTRNQKGDYVLACELVVAKKFEEESKYGRFAVSGDPVRSRYFQVNGAPSVEHLVREMVTASSGPLGRSFQGSAAVRAISQSDDERLRAFAVGLLVLGGPTPSATRPNATSTRNPNWDKDELILALDLYMQHRSNPPGKTSAEVRELSEVLNNLATQRGLTTGNDYRNANGVYMKMMNFRRFVPEYTGLGKVGLTRGNAMEEALWNQYSSDTASLRALAQMIRDAVAARIIPPKPEVSDEGAEADEGGVFTALHRRRERDPKIAKQKKAQVLAATGKLRCEVCGFEFEMRYGSRGSGFIECHHVNALGLRDVRSKTKLTDLALVCSNCHRMIHVKEPGPVIW